MLPAFVYCVDWQLDNDVNLCRLCDAKFGVFKRKHHCRYVRSSSQLKFDAFEFISTARGGINSSELVGHRFCGKIVCSSCSRKKIEHPDHTAKGAQLACDVCFQNATKS